MTMPTVLRADRDVHVGAAGHHGQHREYGPAYRQACAMGRQPQSRRGPRVAPR